MPSASVDGGQPDATHCQQHPCLPTQISAHLLLGPPLHLMWHCAQVLASCTKAHGAPAHVRSAVSRALLLLPDAALVPPPRPPLPSPPPTPPPPPLPTSQFAWDALGRPCVTDGAVVVSMLA